MIKHCKNVCGARLSDHIAKQPQQLLIPECHCCMLRHELRHMVQLLEGLEGM